MPLTATTATARTYRPVRATPGLRVAHCRCRAGRHERAIDEEHGAFSVSLVEQGQFTYRTRAGAALLREGWLMLGNPGDGYACSHEDSDGTGDDCVALSWSAERLDDALSALGHAGAPARFTRAALPPLPRVAALLQLLRDEGREGFALEETSLAVLATVRHALHDAEPVAAAPAGEAARAAAHCIETRSHEALSLDEVARAAGQSSFHLLRSFRRAMGVTPHQYLMRVRLMRAAALLRDTARPVIDVAYEAGWADLSNFNRAFRREFGCSPRELRHGSPKLLKTPRS